MRLKYIKTQLRLGRNSITKRVETARFLYDLFGDKLEDVDFFEWLGMDLGIGDVNKFNDFLKWAEKDHFHGYDRKNNYLSIETRQSIYNY